jgi:hypothetical protein
MEILNGEQFPSTFLEPGGTSAGLALGTMPVATRVVQRSFDATGIAAVEMASHPGRPASGQCGQDQPLPRDHAGSAGLEEGVSVTADDFADFVRRLGFRAMGTAAGP